VAEHWLVRTIWMLVGVQETLTDVMAGESDGVNLIDPPQPISNKMPNNERTNRTLRVMAFLVKSNDPWESLVTVTIGYRRYKSLKVILITRCGSKNRLLCEVFYPETPLLGTSVRELYRSGGLFLHPTKLPQLGQS